VKTAEAADSRTLLARHYGAVWSLARKLVRDDATASDIAQETFTRALAHLGDDVHSVASWLFKIATNLVRDLHRRGGRPEPPPDESVTPACDAILEKREDIARVRRALDALPAETRAAMVLHLQEGLTVPEIAFALDITEHAVRNRIHRALAKLRADLSEES
jgi:RNA polymerase sigma-70 factor (ECF subfamily)